MKIHPAVVVAAVSVFVAAAVAVGVFIITILQGTNVLLELIARSLEDSP